MCYKNFIYFLFEFVNPLVKLFQLLFHRIVVFQFVKSKTRPLYPQRVVKGD